MRAFVVFSVIVAAVVLCADAKLKRKAAHKTARQAPGGCGPNEFACQDGLCIQNEWLCDTDMDCRGGEDETNCPAGCTGEHVTKCNNGQCIPVEFRCDGDNDCGDGTDENGCDVYQCPTGEVKCPTTQLCIEKDWLCDMDDDCGDGWDENAMNCHPNGP